MTWKITDLKFQKSDIFIKIESRENDFYFDEIKIHCNKVL